MNTGWSGIEYGDSAYHPQRTVFLDGRDKPGHDVSVGGCLEAIYTAAVYMMASRKQGTIYIGVTTELTYRIVQHRDGLKEGFTNRYGVKRLVWFERRESIIPAIQRETSLKRYPRQWKINLIERDNPNWNDLFPDLIREEGPLSHLQPREPSR
ncbi:MAG: GIY-YIG nuclease family protein [Phenylobacterium sp.]